MDKNEIGIDHYSPSSLMTYESCPKLFYYTYWLGIKIPEAQDQRHLQFGTAVHASLDHIYALYDNNFGGGWIGAKFSSVKRRFLENFKFIHISDDEFMRFIKTKKGSFYKTKEQLYNAMVEDGLNMLQEYWDNKELLLSEHNIDITKTEIPVKGFLENPLKKEEFHPIPVSMRLDGRNRNGSIVEFKTSSSKYNEDETLHKLQGLAYAFSIYQEEKYVPEVIYVILLKGQKEGKRLQVIHLHYTEEDMIMFYNRVEVILQKMKNKEFSKPIKDHPFFCQCDIYTAALTI